MTDQPEITRGSDWRKPREEGFIKTLPSGNTARLRPVELPDLLIEGQIPDVLTPLVVDMIMEGTEDAGQKEDEYMADQTKETIKFYNAVCKAAFVEPKIVDDPQADDEISIEDVDLFDRYVVFTIAIQGAQALQSFRYGEGPGMDNVHGDEGNGDSAEPEDGTAE